ncbi:iron uptake system component EfeO [Nocardioides ginsengisegetis]|uniref:Iron uptake system component EfeO n=1 Tax=Nocardioides ginsengisegetis TaxID=661491 RepID=A0A7W3J0S8_9ACTN|nr:iron uptake system protein EfeO [Nocardioides ginsengisegetis]MBA8804216.1 iron uptake system component EfeO [Nocardioides ginsengisegetis]
MRIPLLLAALVATPALAACTQNATVKTGDDRTILVTSTDDACDVSPLDAPSGTLTFEVTNDGSEVTEFYLYAEDGQRILGEVENVGPKLSRELTVSVAPGTYVTACKPGMKGTGIRADFTVSDSGAKVAAQSDDEQIAHATEEYQEWVQDESGQLLAQTKAFVAAYTSGDDRKAKALYPVARTHWERIETVAESFGDLDPKMDAREADLEPGQKWTGWHRLEKDLWPARAGKYAALTMKERATYADDLLADTVTLDGRIKDLEFTVDQIANGSRALMEEVATGKVTGEEEYWSRTDLWDFQANVEGARKAFELLEPVLGQKDPELEETLDERFDDLQELLDEQKVGDGFKTYDQLTPQEVKKLADAVNAVSEPLSQLTAAVLS